MSSSANDEQRPDFMIALGLLPPYSAADVKQAYFEKARAAHPDAGGDSASFVRLKEAYDQAVDYVEFRASRTKWLGAQVDRYVAQGDFVAALTAREGRADMESLEWLEHSFGADFAQLVDKLTGIHLNGPGVGDEAIDFLVSNRPVLGDLRTLDLSGSGVTDGGVLSLAPLARLKSLDLSGTAISGRALGILAHLRALEHLDLSRTRVGRWRGLPLRWKYPDLEVVWSRRG